MSHQYFTVGCLAHYVFVGAWLGCLVAVCNVHTENVEGDLCLGSAAHLASWTRQEPGCQDFGRVREGQISWRGPGVQAWPLLQGLPKSLHKGA